jgi:hypothetical protein
MDRLKPAAMLALALFLLLGWTLALSDASTPAVAQYGVLGCLLYAGAISALAAWLITAYLVEVRRGL